MRPRGAGTKRQRDALTSAIVQLRPSTCRTVSPRCRSTTRSRSSSPLIRDGDRAPAQAGARLRVVEVEDLAARSVPSFAAPNAPYCDIPRPWPSPSPGMVIAAWSGRARSLARPARDGAGGQPRDGDAPARRRRNGVVMGSPESTRRVGAPLRSTLWGGCAHARHDVWPSGTSTGRRAGWSTRTLPSSASSSRGSTSRRSGTSWGAGAGRLPQGPRAVRRGERAFASATSASAVHEVEPLLVDGRFHLACVLARRDGVDLPERREPCFFNPQHGPAADDADGRRAVASSARCRSAGPTCCG